MAKKDSGGGGSAKGDTPKGKPLPKGVEGHKVGNSKHEPKYTESWRDKGGKLEGWYPAPKDDKK